MRYHGGPLLVATNAVEGTDIEVIGTWLQDYRSGNPSPSMVGYPSLLCGRHGQGKLFVTTGHPEHFLRTRDFIVGGFIDDMSVIAWAFSKVGKELKMYRLLNTPIAQPSEGALAKA